MPDPVHANPFARHLMTLAWEDANFRAELAASPRRTIEREALRVGSDEKSIAECVELLATFPSCPDSFASQPNDVIIFHEKLLGG